MRASHGMHTCVGWLYKQVYVNESQRRYVCFDVVVRMQACQLHTQLMTTSADLMLSYVKIVTSAQLIAGAFMMQHCFCASMQAKLMMVLASQEWGGLAHTRFKSNCEPIHNTTAWPKVKLCLQRSQHAAHLVLHEQPENV